MQANDKDELKAALAAELVKHAGLGNWIGSYHEAKGEKEKLHGSRQRRKGILHAAWGKVRDTGAMVRDQARGDLPLLTLTGKAHKKVGDWYRKRRGDEEKADKDEQLAKFRKDHGKGKSENKKDDAKADDKKKALAKFRKDK